MRVDGEVRSLDDPIDLDKKFKHDIEVVVDRIVIRENSLGRIAESVEQATALAHGNVNVYMLPDRDAPEGTEGELLEYSLALACPEHGHSIDDLQPRDFSFNAPYGACPECDGLGFKKTVDAEALIEDPSKSIADGVFGSLFGNSNYYPQIFAAVCKHFKVSADTPWEDLPPRVRRAFLDGMGDKKISVDYQKLDGRRSQWDTKFSGVRNILYERYTETTNENTKARLEKYIREEPCSSCMVLACAPRCSPSPWAASPFMRFVACRAASRSSFLRTLSSPSVNNSSAVVSSRKSWNACVFWLMSALII